MDSCTKCLRAWGTRDIVGEAQSGCMTLVGDAIGVGESSTSIRGILGKKFDCKKTMLIAQTQIRVEFSGWQEQRTSSEQKLQLRA